MENSQQVIANAGKERQYIHTPIAYVMVDGKKRYVRSIRSLKKLTRERLGQNQTMAKPADKEKVPVAALEVFKEGNLLRGIIEREIYVIEKGFKKYIFPGLLHKYYGKRVWTVSDAELAQIPLLATEMNYEVEF